MDWFRIIAYALATAATAGVFGAGGYWQTLPECRLGGRLAPLEACGGVGEALLTAAAIGVACAVPVGIVVLLVLLRARRG